MIIKIRTNAYDEYILETEQMPTTEQVAKYVWKLEGECLDLDFYIDTVSFEKIEPAGAI